MRILLSHICYVFLFVVLSPSIISAEGPLTATRITPDNFSTIAVRGPDAIGGVDDWVLSNGTLCATISDISHETFLSYQGGTLVDLGHCGQSDDQWATYHEQLNLSKEQIIPAHAIRTRSGSSEASIIVEGAKAGIAGQTVYTLNLSEPDTLFIETRLTRVEEKNKLSLFGSLILHPRRALAPFVINTGNVCYSKGFSHPYVDTEDRRQMLKVIGPADLHVLVGQSQLKGQISYGVQSIGAEIIRANGKRSLLKQFSINNENFTLLGNFIEPLFFSWGDKPGMMEFIQSRFMDLAVGDTVVVKRRIIVSAKVDAASVTDRIYRGGRIIGQVDNASARLHVFDQDNRPITFVQPEENGHFSARLPKNIPSINIRVDTLWGSQTIERKINHKLTDLGLIKTGVPALLHLPQGHPMRLVFIGINGTETPSLFGDLIGFKVGGKTIPNSISGNAVSLGGIEEDIKTITLLPGHYRVLAGRGPEFSVSQTTVSLESGQSLDLQLQPPQRVLDTSGWISADFHVHSEFSFDSSLPAKRRLVEFVAQGGEVIVPSEHKVTVDFQPLLEQLGLRERLIQIPGVELTGMARTKTAPFTLGHSNVFPVSVAPQQFAGGTLQHEDVRLGTVIGSYKTQLPHNVFQLNHPRLAAYDSDIAFFDHMSDGIAYDPNLPLKSETNRRLLIPRKPYGYRDLDFDAMELLSGEAMDGYEEVRSDWFSLLRQGVFKSATANSDSHATAQVVAMPRNYVKLEQDTIEAFDQDAFLGAIKRGELFGTTGPIVDLKLGSAGMGGLFSGNKAVLCFTVNAAPWVSVQRAVIYVNGRVVAEKPVNAGSTLELPLSFDADAFVFVEVYGEAGEIYSRLMPGFKPFAFTNPIFVDADGDGVWKMGENRASKP